MPELFSFPLVSLQLVSDQRQSVVALRLGVLQHDQHDCLSLLADDFLGEAFTRLPCLLSLDDPYLYESGLVAQLPANRFVLLASKEFHATPEAKLLEIKGFAFTSETLALAVDTRIRFEEVKNAGAKWFSGIWYLEPQQQNNPVQVASQALMLRLLQLVAADAETSQLENIFKQDPQLSYHLLKLVNSVAMGLPNKISSFGQAILILGRRQLKRWLHLLMFTQQQANNLLSPLLASAVLRARFLELACAALGANKEKQEEAFIVGMFSLLGVLFGMTTEQIIRPLNLADSIVGALLEHQGELGVFLHMVEAAERADAEVLASTLAQAGLSRHAFALAQFQACRWMLDVTGESGRA